MIRSKAAVVVVVALALAGCGSSSTHSSSQGQGAAAVQSSVSPAEREANAFRAHAGLAFGTFYHFIYTPYRSGEFRAVLTNKLALSHATAAASFVAQQLEQAMAAASANGSLAKILVPMRILDAGFHAALAKIRTGQFKMSEIEAANIAISAIKGSAANAGAPIAETTPGAV